MNITAKEATEEQEIIIKAMYNKGIPNKVICDTVGVTKYIIYKTVDKYKLQKKVVKKTEELKELKLQNQQIEELEEKNDTNRTLEQTMNDILKVVTEILELIK